MKNYESMLDVILNIFEKYNLDDEHLKMLVELMHVFYHSNDGIYVVDGNGVTVRVNPAFEVISGIQADKLIGKSVTELQREGAFSRTAAAEAIEKKDSVTITQKYKNGKVGLVTSTPIKDIEGQVIRVISNVRDITELQKLYDEILVKERLIQNYSSILNESSVKEAVGIVSASDSMNHAVVKARKVAEIDSTVLICGESGVGKGLVAKLIALCSDRCDKPFITVNCGAIPEQLMESELFGYTGGAFTGAFKEGKIGLAEAANGGILFLDEIGEMPMSLQSKLLTFLETKEIVKVGDIKSKKLDVRVIVATNKNLLDMVQRGSFREDLYYRINVVPIEVAPLRERKEDIILLADIILKELNKKNTTNKRFSREIIDYFIEYDWPGNVRQLRNVIEQMAIFSDAEILSIGDIPKEISLNFETMKVENGATIKSGQNSDVCFSEEIMRHEKQMIEAALVECKSIRAAAITLGMSHSSLHRRMKKLGVSITGQKSDR